MSPNWKSQSRSSVFTPIEANVAAATADTALLPAPPLPLTTVIREARFSPAETTGFGETDFARGIEQGSVSLSESHEPEAPARTCRLRAA